MRKFTIITIIIILIILFPTVGIASAQVELIGCTTEEFNNHIRSIYRIKVNDKVAIQNIYGPQEYFTWWDMF